MKNTWNPWHGCQKISEGCTNCYVYDRDSSYGRNAAFVGTTKDFDLPIQKLRTGAYKIPDGSSLYTCMTSDFFLEAADEWRSQAWEYVRERENVHFTIFTKRVCRINDCVPDDWGNGYPNVTIICSVENQRNCDERLPIFIKIPACHKMIACAPLLENIQIEKYLDSSIELVSACGENGKNARQCDYEWVLSIREQCVAKNIPFHYSKTGTFLIVAGKRYFIPYDKQAEQAHKANIDFMYP